MDPITIAGIILGSIGTLSGALSCAFYCYRQTSSRTSETSTKNTATMNVDEIRLNIGDIQFDAKNLHIEVSGDGKVISSVENAATAISGSLVTSIAMRRNSEVEIPANVNGGNEVGAATLMDSISAAAVELIRNGVSIHTQTDRPVTPTSRPADRPVTPTTSTHTQVELLNSRHAPYANDHNDSFEQGSGPSNNQEFDGTVTYMMNTASVVGEVHVGEQ